MSVKRAKDEINAAEFVEWKAYNLIDVFGCERGDFNSAMMTKFITAALGSKPDITKMFYQYQGQEESRLEEMSDEMMEAKLRIHLGIGD